MSSSRLMAMWVSNIWIERVNDRRSGCWLVMEMEMEIEQMWRKRAIAVLRVVD